MKRQRVSVPRPIFSSDVTGVRKVQPARQGPHVGGFTCRLGAIERGSTSRKPRGSTDPMLTGSCTRIVGNGFRAHSVRERPAYTKPEEPRLRSSRGSQVTMCKSLAKERATGLEPATSSLGTRPVYSVRTGYSTVLQRVTTSTPPVQNGRSVVKNGLGGLSVDPAPSYVIRDSRCNSDIASDGLLVLREPHLGSEREALLWRSPRSDEARAHHPAIRRHASAQRRHASAQMRQWSAIAECFAHSAAQASHATAQARQSSAASGPPRLIARRAATHASAQSRSRRMHARIILTSPSSRQASEHISQATRHAAHASMQS